MRIHWLLTNCIDNQCGVYYESNLESKTYASDDT